MILDQFDKNKPYYHLVYQYFINFYGNNVLWNKSLFKKLKRFEPLLRNNGKWEEYINSLDLTKDEQEYLIKGIPEYPRLLFPNNLGNSFDNSTILINDYTMVDRGGDNRSRIDAVSKMSNMVIVMSYEILPREIRDNKDDRLINFIFHCRNAAAHGGKFNITGNKRFPAEWRGLKITKEDNGLNLVLTPEGVGFLRPMDIVMLMLDLEQKYK